MREYLLQFMSEEAAMGVQFLLALLFVLILFGVFVWFLRLITGKRRRKPAQHQNRLAILDRAQIDETRSLLLVRRDDVEHLVMIGGPSDVVVEANIDPYDEDDETDMAREKPGHQIARRVIAQRPLRTMSLSGSAAKVAESIGLTAASRPEATLAPPPPPRQAAAEQDRVTDTIEPADIRPDPVASEHAPGEWQKAGPAKAAPSADPVKPLRAVPPARQEQNRTAPVPAAIPEIRAQPRSETVRRDIEMHEEPAEDALQHDLAADFENALWQEMQEEKNSDRQTPAVQRPPEPTYAQHTERDSQPPEPAYQERGYQEPAQRPGSEATKGQQNSSERQQGDMDAGFAAAMRQEPETPQQPAYTQVQRERDNLALEDAISGMLSDEQPNIDASDGAESSVYTASESVPDGTERPVDTTHPGRVDDEMSRLLQELAVPSRA